MSRGQIANSASIALIFLGGWRGFAARQGGLAVPLEKKRPGTVSTLFRSHPKIDSRIRATQASIQNLLRQQPLYVVTTSEFNEVKQRLAANLALRKLNPSTTGPTLYRKGVDGEDGAQNQDDHPAIE